MKKISKKVAYALVLVLIATVFVGVLSACDNTEKFTVTFMSEDAVYKTFEVETGALLTDEVANPTHSNSRAVFEGWYTESGKKWKQESEIIMEDITLIAKWTIDDSYTVLFYSNGIKYSEASAKVGKTITMPKLTDVPEGTHFAGWATAKDGEVVYKASATVSYSDLTQYASNYTVNLYSVTPEGDPKTLVIAGWGRFITETTLSAFTDDFKDYCDESEIEYDAIEYRYYTGATTTDSYYYIADFTAKLLAEGDVDMIVACANNIDTQENSSLKNGEVIAKKPISVYYNGKSDATRYVATLNDYLLTEKLYEYTSMSRARVILDQTYIAIEDINLTVAGWGRFIDEATLSAVITDFKAYCTTEKIVYNEIDYRLYAGATNTDAYYGIGAFTSKVVEDGDVGVIVACGDNIDTNQDSAVKDSVKEKKCISVYYNNVSNETRYVASINDESITKTFYDYCSTPRARVILDKNYVAPLPAEIDGAYDYFKNKDVEGSKTPLLVYEAEDADLGTSSSSTGGAMKGTGSTASGGSFIENFGKAGNSITWTFDASADCSIDIAVRMACTNWDGSGNSNMVNLGSFVKITMDSVPLDLENVNLECSSPSSWTDWTTVVLKGLDITAGEHKVVLSYKDKNFPNTDVLYVYSNSAVTIEKVEWYVEPENSTSELVVAAWGRFIDETTISALIEDFKTYCTSQSITYTSVAYRYYGTASYNAIADFTAKIVSDGDVDMIVACAENIDTQTNSNLKGKVVNKKNISIYFGDKSDATRYVASLNEDDITTAFYDYCSLDRARVILDSTYTPAPIA